MNRIYRMSRKEYDGLLKVASEQVPFGIYAVEKDSYAELRCDKCQSMSQLKAMTRQFKSKGFRVLSNKGRNLREAGAEAAEGALMSAT
jgi:hypothetical protein